MIGIELGRNMWHLWEDLMVSAVVEIKELYLVIYQEYG